MLTSITADQTILPVTSAIIQLNIFGSGTFLSDKYKMPFTGLGNILISVEDDGGIEVLITTTPLYSILPSAYTILSL